MAAVNSKGAGPGAPRDSRSSQLYQESKAHRTRLKSCLQKQSISDLKDLSSSPELEFARRELRNVYLKLLFSCTFTSRAKSADSSLWADTTYDIIALYRSRIAELDKEVRSYHEQKQSVEVASKVDRKSRAKVQSSKASTLLRLRASFRDFLGKEEEWWRELAGRVVRVFKVDRARPRLLALGIPCETDDPATSGESGAANSNSAATGMDRITIAARDDPKLIEAAQNPANEARLLEIIHKALISCGDLARYRELYRDDRKDIDEKPMAAGRHAPTRGGASGGGAGRGGSAGRGQRGGGSVQTDSSRPSTPKPRDYSRATAAYEQARLLLPDNGSPSNQLAVLALYKNDVLSSVYYYYRALCVKSPFESARSNLEATYRKSIDKWLPHGATALGEEKIDDVSPLLDTVEERTAKTLKDFVVLHGLLYYRCRWIASSAFAPRCIDGLSTLLVDRALQADAIVKIVVTSIASHYTARLWRSPKAPELNLKCKEEATRDIIDRLAQKTSAADAEHQILVLVLAIIRVLVEVGASETREALESQKRHPPSGPSERSGSASAARNITAVFRRSLPALRIASKWLKSHLEHIQRSVDQAVSNTQSSWKESNTISTQSTAADDDEAKARQLIDSALINATARLWTTYVEFVNIIRFAFPFDSLPSLGTVGQSGATPPALEEDSDMGGFAPMRKAMLASDAGVESTYDTVRHGSAQTKTLHPNEEHLIRIADILIDAKVVAESEDSPIAFDDEHNTFIVTPSLHSQLQSSVEGRTNSTMGRSSVVDPILMADTSNSSGGYGRPSLSDDAQRSLPGAAIVAADEDRSEIASESTEDVVELAMKAVDERRRTLASSSDDENDSADDDDEDDEGEVILIPSSSSSKVKTNLAANLHANPPDPRASGGPLTKAQEQKEARKELRADNDDGFEPNTPGSRGSGQFAPIDKRTGTPPSGQHVPQQAPQQPQQPLNAQSLLLQVLNGPGPLRNDDSNPNKFPPSPSSLATPPSLPLAQGAMTMTAGNGSGGGLSHTSQPMPYFGGAQYPYHGQNLSPSVWGGGPAAFGSATFNPVGGLGSPYSPVGSLRSNQPQDTSLMPPSGTSSPAYAMGQGGQLPRPQSLHSQMTPSSPFSPMQGQTPGAQQQQLQQQQPQQQQQQSSHFGWENGAQAYSRW